MIKTYDFDYDCCKAVANFKVDTTIFTEQHAKETLNFFMWDYDKEADPIDEVMKKYALEAIRVATNSNYSKEGVKGEFENKEGFCCIDGSVGIELMSIYGLDFDEEDLEVTIVV